MKVVVHFFARARDLVGAATATVELPEDATVRNLRDFLAATYPTLVELLPRSAFAVADDFAQDDAILKPNEEVALLPPMSGG